jgi:diguanylate cyclase (GGDEF)-like protein
MIGILPGWSVLEGNMPDRYLAAVLKSIQATARAQACHLLLARGLGRVTAFSGLHPAWPVASSDADFVPVGPWNSDGLIVFAPLRNAAHSQYLQELSERGYPVLFIATGERDPMISVDNRAGIRLAVAHLVDHGHRRIAFIAGDPDDTGDSQARVDAYHLAVNEFGLSTDARLVAPGWHNFAGGYDAACKIIVSGVKFSALVASNDSSAIGAMQAIRDAALQIPGDVAVIGFDDQPDAVAQVPPLTSVHVSLSELGRQALTLMLDHLAGRRQLESVQIPTRLTARQSCGCTPLVVASAGDRLSRSRLAPGAPPKNLRQVKSKLVAEMVAALPQAPGTPAAQQTRRLCAKLVQAFYASLNDGRSDRFQAALTEALQELELANTDINPWQEMVSILRREMTRLPAAWGQTRTRPLAEDMLHQARAAISESAQRQDYRHQSQREITAHALSELTAQLSATLDQRQAVQVLESRLADVGIRHVRVALFEAEAEDPFAWSLLLNPHSRKANRRFSSRAFPPPGLYPRDELLNLALVPLVFQEESLGYVAFDASNLEPVAMIARQLAATFKASRLHAQVLELSVTDALTGVYNRRYFDFFLGNEVDRSQRFGRRLALIMLDIDYFKDYNDSFGHPAGDKALQCVARLLERERRRADVVARIGGDEFALILPETEAAGAQKVAARIHAAMANSTELMRPLTVCIGISVAPGTKVEAQALIQQADQALYQAKGAGRNQMRVSEEPVKSFAP